MIWITRVFVMLLFGLFVPACTEEGPPPPRQSAAQTDQLQSQVLLAEPMQLQRFEWTNQVLSVWQGFTETKPTLLLLSNDPLLQPVPEPLRAEVTQLVKQADPELLAARGLLRRANPLLLRDMTLDAALRSGFFARVVWAIPRQGEAQLEATALGQQLQDAGFATTDEVASLRQVGPLVEGRLRETPLTVGYLSEIKSLGGPVVVHIDPSYFEKLYKNEIKTPLMPLMINSLEQLKALQVSTRCLTYAEANLGQRFALDGRYLGDFLSMMFAEPQKLTAQLSEVWKGQAEILYLKNFMQKEKIDKIARQMADAAPQSAWVRFSLYRAAQQNNSGDAALQALKEAVRLDPVYALEYENLAEQAYDRRRPDAALTMLKLAQLSFPDNPHLTLKVARLSNEQGDRKTALELVRKLQTLDWSAVYYPQMPDYLADFAAHLETK